MKIIKKHQNIINDIFKKYIGALVMFENRETLFS